VPRLANRLKEAQEFRPEAYELETFLGMKNILSPEEGGGGHPSTPMLAPTYHDLGTRLPNQLR
jgi:hypothetical protein